MNYLAKNRNKKFVLDCLHTSNQDERYQKMFLDRHFTSSFDQFLNYPKDHTYQNLKKTIREHFGTGDIILGAGSEDLIIKINQLLFSQKRRVGIVRPIFYRIYESFEGKPVFLSQQDFMEENFTELDAIWLTNPNLLSGSLIESNLLLEIINRHPNLTFILDEAGTFLLKDWQKYSLLGKATRNVLLIESLSKAYGLSGFRAGFATGNETILKNLESTLLTFPISPITEHLINIALDNEPKIDNMKTEIDRHKTEIEFLFNQYSGFKLIASNTNCIYVANDKSIYPHLVSSGINCLNLDDEPGNNAKGYVRIVMHSSKKSFFMLKHLLIRLLEKEYEKKN